MPMVESNVKYLNSYIQMAPMLHREMIRAVIKGYRIGKIKNFKEVERVVLLLASKGKVMTRSG